MDRKILVEGALFFIISCLGIIEGLRLEFQKDTQTIHGPIGPGLYVLFPSALLMITGIAYFVRNYRKNETSNKITEKMERKAQALGIILILGLYIFLIDICGYLLASAIFFLLEFRIVGIKSWTKNALLTVILVGVYYVVFVQFCNMVFPRGILFR